MAEKQLGKVKRTDTELESKIRSIINSMGLSSTSNSNSSGSGSVSSADLQKAVTTEVAKYLREDGTLVVSADEIKTLATNIQTLSLVSRETSEKVTSLSQNIITLENMVRILENQMTQTAQQTMVLQNALENLRQQMNVMS